MIFDFDGVIADSFKVLFELNRSALESIRQSLTPDGYRALFEGNIHKSLNEFLPPKELRAVTRFKVRRYSRVYAGVKPFPFAGRLLATAHKRNKLGIVSSTAKFYIRRLLKANDLWDHFDVVYGSRAHSKKEELVAAIAALGRPAAETYFVTDTIGDVRIGRELGLKTLAVGWGFTSPKRLRAAGCKIVLTDPKQLLRYF